jgi:hypothetical protein
MLPPPHSFNETCQIKINLLRISFSLTGVHFTFATFVSAHDFAAGAVTPFTLMMLLLVSPLISVGSKRKSKHYENKNADLYFKQEYCKSSKCQHTLQRSFYTRIQIV